MHCADCRYGPFWIATTLIFVSAVTGNYASYLSYRRNHSGEAAGQQVWYYDINKVWAHNFPIVVNIYI